jgi:hypothetical protein
MAEPVTQTLHLELYASDAKRVVTAAQALADARAHSTVEPAHLLRALLDTPRVAAVFGAAGFDAASLQREVELVLPQGTAREVSFLSLTLLGLLARAERKGSPGTVGLEHLLGALTEEQVGSAARILRASGVGPDSLLPYLGALKGPEIGGPPTPYVSFTPHLFVRRVAFDLRARLGVAETGAREASVLFAAVASELGNGVVRGLSVRLEASAVRLTYGGDEVVLEWSADDSRFSLRSTTDVNVIRVRRFEWKNGAFVDAANEDLLFAFRASLLAMAEKARPPGQP